MCTVSTHIETVYELYLSIYIYMYVHVYLHVYIHDIVHFTPWHVHVQCMTCGVNEGLHKM